MQFRVFFLLAAGLAVAFASPASRNTNENIPDVIAVPFDNTQIFDLDDDFAPQGGFFSFNPFSNPFSGFMQSMDDMFKSLRDQMTQVLHRIPTNETHWSIIPEGKGNTTSTVKVINGHKVVINETTYSNHGDNSGSVFKVRVVDIHPTSEEDTASEEHVDVDDKTTSKPSGHREIEETTPKSDGIDKGSPEILEEANEIPQGHNEIQNAFADDIETLGEDFDIAYSPENDYRIPVQNFNTLHREPYIQDTENNNVHAVYKDLSNDILINQMMADSNAPINPDSEFL